MRRIVFSLLLAGAGVLSAGAQDAISTIRKHYAEAQQMVAEYAKSEKEGEMPFPEYYEVNISQNLPGTGPHMERIRLYYYLNDLTDDWKPDGPMLSRNLHFVTWKYNYAARDFYEEYLFDQQGSIEFIYCRNADMDDFNGGELRFYFKDGKLIKVLVSIRNAKTDKYEQKYSGTTIPEPYVALYKSCQSDIKRFKKLFDDIDSGTFH